MKIAHRHIGIFIASTVICCWFALLYFLLRWNFSFGNPLVYIFIIVQMHLFTGLFITAHDAMHGTISSNKKLNTSFGYIAVFLYAGFSYKHLYRKHHQHHKHVHTHEDPDFAEGGFWKWYFRFMRNYVSIIQIIIMALAYNILKIWVDEVNLLLFWVLPALMSTFQLFYFGTYLPHKGEHNNTHHSSTQKKNHLFAFLSCYFFGYHLEHHEQPHLPWWKLYKTK